MGSNGSSNKLLQMGLISLNIVSEHQEFDSVDWCIKFSFRFFFLTLVASEIFNQILEQFLGDLFLILSS